MAILVDERSRVVIQGITGNIGRSFAERMARHYRNFVGGVTPGKGGSLVAGVPVFDSVAEAVEATGANTSVITVPAPFVKDAVYEGLDAGIRVLSIYTEHVPIHDATQFVRFALLRGARLVGPNAAGVVSPGKASAAELNEDQLPLRPGPVGVMSKSGTLSYEVIDGLGARGLGQSTVCCLGGDPILGTTFREALELFEADPETRVVVLLGEIGGTDEMAAAEFIPRAAKPVVAYIAGRAAPPGKRMGHAGAIVTRAADTAAAKMEILRKAGARVAEDLSEIPEMVAAAV